MVSFALFHLLGGGKAQYTTLSMPRPSIVPVLGGYNSSSPYFFLSNLFHKHIFPNPDIYPGKNIASFWVPEYDILSLFILKTGVLSQLWYLHAHLILYRKFTWLNITNKLNTITLTLQQLQSQSEILPMW